MIKCDQDPDIVRWGLHQLLDVCSISNSGSQCTVTQYDPDLSQVGYVIEGYCQTEQADLESDEVIAHALQEELSKVAAAEASGSVNPVQESILVQDWLGPSRRFLNNNVGCDNDWKATDCSGKNEELDNSSKKKIEGDDQSKEEKVEGDVGEVHGDDLLHSLDMTDESSFFDGEVGKRLNQMVPVPHVPKINGELPSSDEEMSDHQRLLERLELYNLVENKVQGDGNCQFRALSDQLYGSPEHHKVVREQVIIQLKSHPQIYEGYVPMAYGDYLNKMSKNGEWGDHVTLQAAADKYGVRIFVITSFKDTCCIEILPNYQKSQRVLCLSFWAEVHYNSIYPEGELPALQNRKKKKWWIL
ncbi:hypothetical protein Dsin_004371 [Dipteronia sinensis]|uniref:ubiquitinyl hydrolase 1 n=1 Tax=Dipteronia sinensis TaxID=43782 RepID=A0AAE0BAW4_9ROSI|nr:hypothetical protein Dsin_004371 [Dipteronia sinensis]